MDLTCQFPNGDGVRLTKAMRAHRARNTKEFDGFTRHTDYHWSTKVCGGRLDFYPSQNKWRYANKTYEQLHTGYSVLDFIKEMEKTIGG